MTAASTVAASTSLVLFGFDGTLADTAPPVADVLTASGEKAGRSEMLTRVRRVLAEPDPSRPLLEQLAELGDGADPERLAGALRRRASTGIRLYPGVYRLLLGLQRRGTDAGCFARWPEDLLVEMLDDLGLRGYLDPVVSVETVESLPAAARAVDLIRRWMREDAERGDGDRGSDAVGGSSHARGDTAAGTLVFVSGSNAELEGARIGSESSDLVTVWIDHGYGSAPPASADEQLDRIGGVARVVR